MKTLLVSILLLVSALSEAYAYTELTRTESHAPVGVLVKEFVQAQQRQQAAIDAKNAAARPKAVERPDDWGIDILNLKKIPHADNTSTDQVSSLDGTPIVEIDFAPNGQIARIRTYREDGSQDEIGADVLGSGSDETVCDPLNAPLDPFKKDIQNTDADEPLYFRESWEGTRGVATWMRPGRLEITRTVHEDNTVETRWRYPDGSITDETRHPNGTRQVDAYRMYQNRSGNPIPQHIYREYAIAGTSVIFSR